MRAANPGAAAVQIEKVSRSTAAGARPQLRACEHDALPRQSAKQHRVPLVCQQAADIVGKTHAEHQHAAIAVGTWVQEPSNAVMSGCIT